MQERVIAVPATLDSRSVAELARAIELAMTDDTVSVVVLQGTQDAFCRGLDFDEIADVATADDLRARATGDYCRCLMALRRSDRPVIAVVQGVATGGGLGLVAAADVVIASDRASFGLPEVLFGLAPAMVLPLLLERLSTKTARVWALTGATRNAEQARLDGLVDVVVSNHEIEAELKRWLKALRRGQRRGVKSIKHLSAVMPAMDPGAALELGRNATLASLNEPRVLEAIRRFKDDGVLPWELE